MINWSHLTNQGTTGISVLFFPLSNRTTLAIELVGKNAITAFSGLMIVVM
jgi:hypothetical protein